MGMTLAEKILARTSQSERVSPGEFVTAQIDRMMINDMFVLVADTLREAGIDRLADPQRACVIFDHFVPPPSPKHAEMLRAAMTQAKEFQIPNIFPDAGVSHQVMCEKGFVRPGELILGTDSHSTMYGAFAAAGAGIGATEMAYLLATGELWMQVPPSVKIELTGHLPSGVFAKDLVLHIIGRLGGDYGRYKSVEYCGAGTTGLSMSERMTISNMGVELGTKFALFESDATTLHYLRSRNVDGVDLFAADEDAAYDATHAFDLDQLTPQVSRPHRPDHVCSVDELRNVRIDQAYLGSCTNARLDDLEIAANVVRGRQIAANTRFLVAPASKRVLLEATRAGHIETLLEAGATVLPPGCGACAGLHSGLLGKGEVCLSSTNRNFNGRMGSPEAEIYLASPATVAASAVAGKIIDSRAI